jgi:hypothetical protein
MVATADGSGTGKCAQLSVYKGDPGKGCQTGTVRNRDALATASFVPGGGLDLFQFCEQNAPAALISIETQNANHEFVSVVSHK